MAEYSVPLGTPIQTCACGVRICCVAVPIEGGRKGSTRYVYVEYSRDETFCAQFPEHRCLGAAAIEVERRAHLGARPALQAARTNLVEEKK